MNMHRIGRRAAAAATLAALGACSSAGGLGNILGSVLGGGGSQGSQVSGYVQGVDPRSQIIALQQPNGQPVNLLFYNQTRVVYNNQSYAVTSLDSAHRAQRYLVNSLLIGLPLLVALAAVVISRVVKRALAPRRKSNAKMRRAPAAAPGPFSRGAPILCDFRRPGSAAQPRLRLPPDVRRAPCIPVSLASGRGAR